MARIHFAYQTRVCLAVVMMWLGLANPSLSAEWRGQWELEWRGFAADPLDPRQHGDSWSLRLAPEFYHAPTGDSSFSFGAQVRLDQHDEERSQVDISELAWSQVRGDWEWHIGVRKQFWGVTESQHLVDIVNQSDLVAALDGEQKLGQPMLHLSYLSDWGSWDLFALLGFRERPFPGVEGRLRTQPWVAQALTSYESPDEHRHIDGAIRWAHSAGVWDWALSHFKGTARAPQLIPALWLGEPVLQPHYPQLRQTGLELQATLGAWLWKWESVWRRLTGQHYRSAVAGFEYTWSGVAGGASELGLLWEGFFDSRVAPPPFAQGQFLGVRWVANDMASTEVLVGLMHSSEPSTRLLSLEASRRLADAWRLSVEVRVITATTPGSALDGLRDDDYLGLRLARFY